MAEINLEFYSESSKKAQLWRDYKTLKEKARNLRRNLILEMIMENPNRNWSYRQIAEEARKLPWFQKNMPNYTHETARKDYAIIKQETRARREELAEDALVKQLDEVDDQIASVLTDLENLGDLIDYGASIEEINQYVNAKNKLLISLDRLWAKQSKLLPIDIPKKVEIDSRHITLDAYLQIQKEYKQELGQPKSMLHDGIIEGEYETD